MKSASLILRVEATRPAVSTRAPAPKAMPLGLIRKTLPFETRRPRMADGSPPVTRFKTALFVDCWTKRVSSPRSMEKPCQLMMAPGELAMFRIPAAGRERLAWPWAATPPVGLACAAVPLNKPATTPASTERGLFDIIPGPDCGTCRRGRRTCSNSMGLDNRFTRDALANHSR